MFTMLLFYVGITNVSFSEASFSLSCLLFPPPKKREIDLNQLWPMSSTLMTLWIIYELAFAVSNKLK